MTIGALARIRRRAVEATKEQAQSTKRVEHFPETRAATGIDALRGAPPYQSLRNNNDKFYKTRIGDVNLPNSMSCTENSQSPHP
jgi:hypothetical protein